MLISILHNDETYSCTSSDYLVSKPGNEAKRLSVEGGMTPECGGRDVA